MKILKMLSDATGFTAVKEVKDAAARLDKRLSAFERSTEETMDRNHAATLARLRRDIERSKQR